MTGCPAVLPPSMKLKPHEIAMFRDGDATRSTRANTAESPDAPVGTGGSGCLIVNADDWGRDRATTERIFECTELRRVSSVSAMVFMADSARAAETARTAGIDAGLHLNLSESFSASSCPAGVMERQGELRRYLLRNPLARVLYHPGLTRSFQYVVKAQLDEYRRLYGSEPDRIDGHHHLHLCSNVILKELLPVGTIVRRNFTFLPGEKSLLNRWYRKAVDRRLARRHSLVDFLYNLVPIEAARLERIFALARHSIVELETHPAQPDDYTFLTENEIWQRSGDLRITSFRAMCSAPAKN